MQVSKLVNGQLAVGQTGGGWVVAAAVVPLYSFRPFVLFDVMYLCIEVCILVVVGLWSF